MKPLKTLFLATACLFGTAAFAQQPAEPALGTDHYRTAIGLRAGYSSGLTIKQFTGSTRAIEGILGFHGNGFRATVLIEQNVNAGVPGLHWYYGLGGHAALAADHGHFHVHDHHYHYGDGELGIGVDGIVGLEYKIRPIPFAISFDVKPFIEVTNSGAVWGSLDPGVGIKFTF